MSKYIVCLGRLVRETATVIVEAKSKEDLEQRLNEVYDDYEGTDWSSDDEWGCEPSDSHTVVGNAPKNVPVDVTLKED